MKLFNIKTKSEMEQTYNIEAESEEEAKKIALDNINEVLEQTQIGKAEILSCELISED